MIRTFDIIFSLAGLLVTAPLMLVLYFICRLETQHPIFLQQRVGRHQKPFTLFKFRTMYEGIASTSTHLVPNTAITNHGRLLRKTKLDELPQLFNVLIGDMSLVGPRPCLPNQTEVVNHRAANGIFEHKPGITGLAQVKRINMSNPELLAEADLEMISTFSLKNYLRLIFLTVFRSSTSARKSL